MSEENMKMEISEGMAPVDRTQGTLEKIYLMAQDAMIYLDELILAYRASDIMRFDENRLRALEQLHEIRRLVLASAEKAGPQTEESVDGESAEEQIIAPVKEKDIGQLIQDAKNLASGLIAYETDSPRQLAFAVRHLARALERVVVEGE